METHLELWPPCPWFYWPFSRCDAGAATNESGGVAVWRYAPGISLAQSTGRNRQGTWAGLTDSTRRVWSSSWPVGIGLRANQRDGWEEKILVAASYFGAPAAASQGLAQGVFRHKGLEKRRIWQVHPGYANECSLNPDTTCVLGLCSFVKHVSMNVNPPCSSSAGGVRACLTCRIATPRGLRQKIVTGLPRAFKNRRKNRFGGRSCADQEHVTRVVHKAVQKNWWSLTGFRLWRV